MLLKFINYLRSKLPRDKVLGPWIDEIQTQKESVGGNESDRGPSADPPQAPEAEDTANDSD